MEAGTSAQHQLFRRATFLKKLVFFRKEILRTTYLSWRAAFLERPLFQKTLPSIAAAISEELLSHNILLQKSCCFIATIPLHSYTYYLPASN